MGGPLLDDLVIDVGFHPFAGSVKRTLAEGGFVAHILPAWFVSTATAKFERG
jgi:hypothetical protein